MANLLYMTDVFCPWCYGFAAVMRRITAQNPELSVRVLGGGLLDEMSTVAEMVEEVPNIKAFFKRLVDTTGQEIGEGFLQLLEPGHGDVPMFSPGVAAPLMALKKLAPGQQLEQVEAFQHAFYGQGRDVLAMETQLQIAATFGVDVVAFAAMLNSPELMGAAKAQDASTPPCTPEAPAFSLVDAVQAEMDEAAAIMGEFTLYPTLYLEDGNQRRLLARGYAPYEEVAAKLADLKAAPALGAACGLDGHCH